MLNVLSSTKYVVDHSKNVKIDLGTIYSLASKVKWEDLSLSGISLTRKKWELDTLVQIIFVFNTINFCFWAGKDEKKWTVNIDGEELDGSRALFRCIEKEVEKNPGFLAGDKLVTLTPEHLRLMLAGDVPIPLFDERLKCLHQAGRVLKKQFGNSFTNLYQKAENNAITLAESLITNFSYFDDISEYQGKKVGFYKRAQLNSKMINDVLIAEGRAGMDEIDQLTAFADYKIPQILRNLEVVRYTKELAKKIDSFELIESGSEEEVEIRAATVWAVETIRHRLKKDHGFVTAAQVDSILWNLSQTKTRGEFPYHRTLTIDY